MNSSKNHDLGPCQDRAGRSGGKVSFLVGFDLHRWREIETRYE